MDLSTSAARQWWTPRRRSFAWLAGVALACLAGIIAVYRLTVHTVPGRLFGDTALRGADLTQTEAAEEVRAVLDIVTTTSMITAVALAAVIALIRLRRASGLAAIGILVVASALSRLLKSYVLTRPDLGLDESAPATLNSLPSGHTTAAFSIVAALLFVVPVALRSTIAVGGIVFASATALATMWAGWHRAADSLASFLLVTMCAALAGLVVLALERSAGEAPPVYRMSRRSRPGRSLLVIGGGILLFGAALIAVVAIPLIRDSAIGPPLAFLSAGGLLVGSATLSTAVIVRIVDRIAPATPTVAGPADGPDEAAHDGTTALPAVDAGEAAAPESESAPLSGQAPPSETSEPPPETPPAPPKKPDPPTVAPAALPFSLPLGDGTPALAAADAPADPSDDRSPPG